MPITAIGNIPKFSPALPRKWDLRQMDTNPDPIIEIRKTINTARSRGDSWREIGRRFGLNPAMARLLGNGYQPGQKIRRQLGLPVLSAVVVIGEGVIPEGTQVFTARRCPCGQWFIPNSGNRQWCFICHPYSIRWQHPRPALAEQLFRKE